jgi:hypothetical protein
MKCLLTIIFALLSISSLGICVVQGQQANEDTPLPEYYGLYLVIDGKLCGLDVEANSCSLNSAQIKVGRRAGVGEVLDGAALSTSYPVAGIKLKKGIRFLSYRENPSSYLGALRLIPMLYIRNIAVDTGWPKNVKRSGTENAWDTGNPSEMGGEWNKLNDLIKPIQLLVKPLKNNMVLGVPARELTPGLYRLSFGEQVMGNEPKLYFWVGNAAEAEAVKCVDASYKYAMMMSESEFKPCGDELKGLTNASETTSDSSPTESIMAELISIENRVSEASLKGDKATIDSLLAENYTFTNLGNRKTWDRATYLSKIKRDKSVKSFECKDYKLRSEGEVAVVSGICESYVQNFLISMTVTNRFTDRLRKIGGEWKFISSEILIVPNTSPNRSR